MLLLPDAEDSEGYVLLYYCCLPEYELENLECLGEGGYFITGFLPDYAWGQQDFIARMQRLVLKGQADIGQARGCRAAKARVRRGGSKKPSRNRQSHSSRMMNGSFVRAFIILIWE